MAILDSKASSDARSIGKDSYEIQQEILRAAGMLIVELAQRLQLARDGTHTIEFTLLDENQGKTAQEGGGEIVQRSPTISVSLDDKKVEAKASALKAAIAENLSIDDIKYIAKAIDAPQSDTRNPELNRNLSISVDGRDVLVIQDGKVLVNDILSRDNAREATVPEGERTPSTKEHSEVVEGEIVEEVRREEQGRTESGDVIDAEYSEAPPQTPIAILKGVVGTQSNERLSSNVESLGNAPEAPLESSPETEFTEERREILRPIDPPITRRQREEERQLILESASTLLDRYGVEEGGKETYDGNLYRVERTSPDTLTISAKDGRGTVFESNGGRISENLTPVDRYRFADIRERLSLPALEASKTRIEDHERG